MKLLKKKNRIYKKKDKNHRFTLQILSADDMARY